MRLLYMSNHAPSVELSDVGYEYPNGLRALDAVDLTVRAGEIVALVGPSGCGKSTLLSLISGLIEPTAGAIRVHGEDGKKRLGRFSLMPQKDLLLPWRSALGNASLLLEAAGVSRTLARGQALAMLKQLRLDEFAEASPRSLSGGMRQRIALIRTFLPGRDVLLDEPFGALDAITRAALQEWLQGLHAVTPRSILLVTHDVEEAVLLGDRVYLMSSRPGRIIFEQEIPLERPRTISLTGKPEFTRLKSALLDRLRSALRLGGEPWAA